MTKKDQLVFGRQRMLFLSSLATLFCVVLIALPAHALEVETAGLPLQLAQAQQPVQPIPQPNVGMIRALSELTALKEEVKVLRNRLEEMYFSQEYDSRRREDLFQDVDRRLTNLEQLQEDFLKRLESLEALPPMTDSKQILAENRTDGGNTTDAVNSADNTVTASAPVGERQMDDIGQTDQNNQTGSVKPVIETTVADVPAPIPPANGTSSVSLSEQDAYDSAFNALKLSRYEEAIEQFQRLVTTWPESELADDSLYWMSEANFVNREFEAALNGFRTLIDRFPNSSRVPEAMLKVGNIQYDIGAYDQAAKTFEEILSRFPGHQVTIAAEIRLRRIKQTIN